MARISRKTAANPSEPPPAPLAYQTAVYVRLSDEDFRKKNSGSIETQKEMLIRFIQSQPDLRLFGVYEDVNYTGTNFRRPAFARMIEDIQAGRVNCVLVKDLSRFGRSFEETGHYLERVFPSLGVRFIAPGDGYDSLTTSPDDCGLIVPLKNLMNEVYARDLSRKVRAAVKARQKRGVFCGPYAPYGYVKDGPAFAEDGEAAAVVRRIYRWALEGCSHAAIAQTLNDERVPPPARYRFEKGLSGAKRCKEAKLWYPSTVRRITENSVYIGQMVQGRQKSNFLNGGGVLKTEREEWVIVEHTHPAIVDADVFEAVQMTRRANGRKRPDVPHACRDTGGGDRA